MIEEFEQLEPNDCILLSSESRQSWNPMAPRVWPRVRSYRGRTPHARPSVLKEPARV